MAIESMIHQVILIRELHYFAANCLILTLFAFQMGFCLYLVSLSNLKKVCAKVSLNLNWMEICGFVPAH